MATKVRIPLQDAGEAFGSVDPGTYRLRVTGAGLGETQKGDPKFQIKCVIVEPKNAKGQPVTINYQYNPTALALLRQALSALVGKDIPKKALDLNPKVLVGKEMYARAYKSTSNGTEFTNWTDYKSVKAEDEDEEEEPEEEEEEAEEDEDELTFDDDDDD